MSLESQVIQFITAQDLEIPEKPKLPSDAEKLLCHELILDKLIELNEAFDSDSTVDIAEACANLVYAAATLAVTIGLPIDALLREVHRSHMANMDNSSDPDIVGILMPELYPDSTGSLSFQENIQ